MKYLQMKKYKINNHIKVFGYVAYHKSFSQDKSNFESNSKKRVFLGFDKKSNCYIITS